MYDTFMDRRKRNWYRVVQINPKSIDLKIANNEPKKSGSKRIRVSIENLQQKYKKLPLPKVISYIDESLIEKVDKEKLKKERQAAKDAYAFRLQGVEHEWRKHR